MRNNNNSHHILNSSIVFSLLSFTACAANGNGVSAEIKPNIVLINIDDMGWRDVGFMGSEYYVTPNIDKLASQGMIFTQAYAAASNCAPSRACLMSGQWTPRHGIYTVTDSERGNSKDRKLIPTPNNEYLKDDINRTLFTQIQGIVSEQV